MLSNGRVKERSAEKSVRIVGLDDWAWRKGSTYGTIIVDLERREVIDLLPDRSASATAGWLKQHPDIEIVSRDRCGSFARGAYEGVPEARQIADRLHILQNLREAVQAQLSRVAGPSARPLLPADVDDESQSGESNRIGRVSLCSDAMMRSLLYEAAQVMLTRATKWSWLKAWVMSIAKQRGQQKAIVALGRRLAVIMHRMWSDGTEFRWTRETLPKAA